MFILVFVKSPFAIVKALRKDTVKVEDATLSPGKHGKFMEREGNSASAPNQMKTRGDQPT